MDMGWLHCGEPKVGAAGKKVAKKSIFSESTEVPPRAGGPIACHIDPAVFLALFRAPARTLA